MLTPRACVLLQLQANVLQAHRTRSGARFGQALPTSARMPNERQEEAIGARMLRKGSMVA
jgi:hypothetical protein